MSDPPPVIVQWPLVWEAEPAKPGDPISAFVQPGGSSAQAETAINRGMETKQGSLAKLRSQSRKTRQDRKSLPDLPSRQGTAPVGASPRFESSAVIPEFSYQSDLMHNMMYVIFGRLVERNTAKCTWKPLPCEREFPNWQPPLAIAWCAI